MVQPPHSRRERLLASRRGVPPRLQRRPQRGGGIAELVGALVHVEGFVVEGLFVEKVFWPDAKRLG
jgi:hypothetical protein